MPPYTTPVDQYSRRLPEYMTRSRGNTFCAANQAAVTFGVGLSATLATFGLHNPVGSGVNLVVRSCQIALSAVPAALVAFYYAVQPNPAAAAPTTPTALTVRNIILGNATANAGLAYSAGTLAAAPVIIRPAFSILAALSIVPPAFNDRIDGEIIVAPGTQLVVQGSAAASAFIGMVWEELPIW